MPNTMFILKSNTSFFALIVFVFAIINAITTPLEGALCERASQTWSGSCLNTGGCNNQCKNWEKARNEVKGKQMCFCYFDSCTAPKLCEKASQTWSGAWFNNGGCDKQCKNWEKAVRGNCKTRGAKKMCFCYFNKC
ncbi:hypothetical protein MKX01_013953 [Papaver californicum]|nr:hypothetical protein MKX01_013953 [Papaver californicum]